MAKQEMSKQKALQEFLFWHCDQCLADANACDGCEIGVAIECIGKQIPMKPTLGGAYKINKWECPNCKSYFAELNDRPRHCAECGQRIDWSDNE